MEQKKEEEEKEEEEELQQQQQQLVDKRPGHRSLWLQPPALNPRLRLLRIDSRRALFETYSYLNIFILFEHRFPSISYY